MKIYLSLLITILTLLSSFAQSRFDDVQIKTTPLTDQIYMLEGAGGNIGLLVGAEGALLIDDQFAPLSEKIKEVVSGLTDGGVQYVMNTHWHGDHTGGNENFGKEGATIIAQQNVRKRMSTETIRGENVTPPSPAAALPGITYGEDLQLYFNGQKLMAIHVHNAHTDGDAFVWMPKSNVLHMGDCFFHQRFPYIDLNSGGSVDGVISAVEAALLLVDDETQIIPGHGPMATKADLSKYYVFLKTMKERVQEYTSVGRGADMIDADKVVAGYEDWAWAFIDAQKLVDTFHASLTQTN